MKKFIAKVFLYAASFYLLFLLVFFVAAKLSFNRNSTSYYAAFKDKMSKANSISGKKMIITGGSGCAFGIDSRRIKDSLGCEVVNLGLHADINYKFQLASAFDAADTGDIILLISEYEATGTAGEGYGPMFELLSIYPEYAKYCCARDYWNFPFYGGFPTKSNLSKLFIKSFNKPESSFFFRKGFNEYGDLTSHLKAKSKWKRCSSVGLHELKGDPEYFIDYISSFFERCKEKHITFLFSFPAIATSSVDTAYVNPFRKKMEAQKNFVISTSDNYVLCDSFFIGTNYHLTGPGRQVRTTRLIEDLKNKLLSQK